MKRRVGRLIALLCGCALWLAGVLYQNHSQTSGVREWFRILSNGALIPGVLFVGLSALAWIAGEGMFDGIKYTMSSLAQRVWGKEKRYASYYDYIRREKKGASYPMLLPGLFFLAAAVVLTLLYYLW